MRAPRYLRRTAELRVEQATIHGGVGEIIINDWIGSCVWGADEQGWEHVSVAPYNKAIMPSWEEMCRIKDIFWSEEEMVLQIHPPKSQYVNIQTNCLHLWKPKDKAILEYMERKK